MISREDIYISVLNRFMDRWQVDDEKRIKMGSTYVDPPCPSPLGKLFGKLFLFVCLYQPKDRC